MPVTIRESLAGDEPALIALVQALQAHEATVFDRMKPPEAIGPWYVETMRRLCAESAGRIFLAELDGDAIGYAIGYAMVLTGLSSEDEADEVFYRYGLVAELSVAPAARGLGVGQQLLARCEQAAREAGLRWFRISVLAGNALAIRAYDRFGFKPHVINMEKDLGSPDA